METKQTTRELTTAALCAKEIRKDLKRFFPTIKFKVTSANFSMGDSVSVSWTDGVTEEEVEKVLGKYQWGHFDGSVDLYECSNRRDDIPQTKFLHIKRELSEKSVKVFAEKYKKTWNLDEPTEDIERGFEHGNEWTNWFQLAWRGLRDVKLN